MTIFLAELAAILVVAKLGGELASRLDQPPVLGQLLGGLALGAVLSALPLPALDATSAQIGELANLGVVVLMFLAGLETDWDQLRSSGRAAFAAACLGVAVPLAAGLAVGLAFGLPAVEALFVGVILTATSVTITAQTLLELDSLQTVEGATILGAAVIDDVIGLIVLSVTIALTGAQQTNLALLGLTLLVFFGAATLIAPYFIERVLHIAERLRGAEALLAVALALGLLMGAAAEWAGLAAITGAYIAGLLINRANRFEHLVERTRVVAYGLFVPIFLVKTGMDARLGELGTALAFVVVATLAAVLAKIAGSGLGARLCGLTGRQSIVVGVGMVSRGEVALVAATLALSAGAISQAVFSATVIVVVATTLVTPPLLRVAIRHAAESSVARVASGAG